MCVLRAAASSKPGCPGPLTVCCPRPRVRQPQQRAHAPSPVDLQTCTADFVLSVAVRECPAVHSAAVQQQPCPGLAAVPSAATAAETSAGHAQQQHSVRYWAGVARLLRCPEAAVFLSMAVFMGVGVGNIEGYLFLFLDELGECAGRWQGPGRGLRARGEQVRACFDIA